MDVGGGEIDSDNRLASEAELEVMDYHTGLVGGHSGSGRYTHPWLSRLSVRHSARIPRIIHLK